MEELIRDDFMINHAHVTFMRECFGCCVLGRNLFWFCKVYKCHRHRDEIRTETGTFEFGQDKSNQV